MGKHGFYKHNAKEVDIVNVGELDSMAGEDGRIDLGKMRSWAEASSQGPSPSAQHPSPPPPGRRSKRLAVK